MLQRERVNIQLNYLFHYIQNISKIWSFLCYMQVYKIYYIKKNSVLSDNKVF